MSQTRRRPKRVTIKDVAQAAGVSVTTVSNVLNNRTEAMTEETLQRIQATIRDLNYRPSNVARSLVTNHTATIGVIVVEIETPLFLQALNIIESTARNADHSILLCTTAHDLSDEAQAINLLLEKQVDGIIYLSTSTYPQDDYLTQLPPSAPPMVLINRGKTYDDTFDQISLDHFEGINKLIDYLVELGHTRIAHLYGPQTRHGSVERLRGYRAGLERHRLAYYEDYVQPGDYEATQAEWEQATLELLNVSPRPTVIIAANDIVAATAMRTVQRAGFHVPKDISIVGIDNHPFCTYLNPALTTVQFPIIEAGKLATELLLTRTKSRRIKAKKVTLSYPLIIRESSGRPAGY